MTPTVSLADGEVRVVSDVRPIKGVEESRGALSMAYREIAVHFCAIAVPTRGDEVGRRWMGLTWR